MAVLAVLGACTFVADCAVELSPSVRTNCLKKMTQCRKMLSLPLNWEDREIALKNAWKVVEEVANGEKDGAWWTQLTLTVGAFDVLASGIYADSAEDDEMYSKRLEELQVSFDQFQKTVLDSPATLSTAVEKMLQERAVWVNLLYEKCRELRENRTKEQKEWVQSFPTVLQMGDTLSFVYKKRICVKVVSIVSALALTVFHMISIGWGLVFIAALAGFSYHDYTRISTVRSIGEFFNNFKSILEQYEKVDRCKFDLLVKDLNLTAKQGIYEVLQKKSREIPPFPSSRRKT